MLDKWEYKYIDVSKRFPLTTELTLFGNKGWELVNTILIDDQLHYYFKRKV